MDATTGAITPTSQGSTPTHTGPTRVASDKPGDRLYVLNNTLQDLSAYAITRSDGSLNSLSGSPFAIGRTPFDVVVAPSGNYVYVTARNSTSDPTSFVYAFAVESDGSLKPVSGSPFATGNSANPLAIDPQEKYLYVGSSQASDPSAGELDVYSIGSNGALTPVPGSPFNYPHLQCGSSNVGDLAIHPSGNFIILSAICQGIVIFRLDRTTGTLALVNGSPFPPGDNLPLTTINFTANSVAMDPQGIYFWVTAEYCHSGCSVRTETWKLNTTTGVPTFLESGFGGCELLVLSDPSGQFLYELGETDSGCASSSFSPTILGLNVNRSDGSLNNISGSPWQSAHQRNFLLVGLAVTP